MFQTCCIIHSCWQVLHFVTLTSSLSLFLSSCLCLFSKAAQGFPNFFFLIPLFLPSPVTPFWRFPPFPQWFVRLLLHFFRLYGVKGLKGYVLHGVLLGGWGGPLDTVSLHRFLVTVDQGKRPA